ncbi:MAG: nitroreductase family protein, partial [Dehalococcoidia bacterium]|nr:nitroreductase family protein [Dehalococcoidia bacterium]
MDTIKTIRSRRAAKEFSSSPVYEETLLNLVDLARYSPSGGNKNSWQFVVITSRKNLDRLSET